MLSTRDTMEMTKRLNTRSIATTEEWIFDHSDYECKEFLSMPDNLLYPVQKLYIVFKNKGYIYEPYIDELALDIWLALPAEERHNCPKDNVAVTDLILKYADTYLGLALCVIRNADKYTQDKPFIDFIPSSTLIGVLFEKGLTEPDKAYEFIVDLWGKTFDAELPSTYTDREASNALVDFIRQEKEL